MASNEELLKSYRKEKIKISHDIEEEETDLFKYQNRKDFSSARACRERIGNLKSKLSNINNNINRLERIIKNDGVDPYSPIPHKTASPNTNISIDEGSIKQTVDLTIDITGTKGKGKNKRKVNINKGQRIERNSHIEHGNVISQKTDVINIDSPKKLGNGNLISNDKNKISKFSDDIPESPNKPRKYTRKGLDSIEEARRTPFKNRFHSNTRTEPSIKSNSEHVKSYPKKPRKTHAETSIKSNSGHVKSYPKKPRKYIRKARPHVEGNKSFKTKPWIVNGKRLPRKSNEIDVNNMNDDKKSGAVDVDNKKGKNNIQNSINKQSSNSKSIKWVKKNGKWVNLSQIQDEEVNNKKTQSFTKSNNSSIKGFPEKPKKYIKKTQPFAEVNKSFKTKSEIINGKKVAEKSATVDDNGKDLIKKSKNMSETNNIQNSINKQSSNSKSIKWVKKNGKWVRPSQNQYDDVNILFSPEMDPEYIKRMKSEKIKMDNFLSFLNKEYSWEEACERCDISPLIVDDWYHKGLYGFDENTIYFYNEIKEIEKSKFNQNELISDNTGHELTDNGSVSESSCNGDPNDSIGSVVDNEALKDSLDDSGDVLVTDDGLKESSEDNVDVFVDDGLKESSEDNVDVRVNDEINVKINDSQRRFCQYCGARIDYRDKFCMYCGKKLVGNNYNNERILDKIQRKIKRFLD